jgi:hypothetical protein
VIVATSPDSPTLHARTVDFVDFVPRNKSVPYVEIVTMNLGNPDDNADDNNGDTSTLSTVSLPADDNSDGNRARTRTHTKSRFRTMIFIELELPHTVTNSRAQHTV